MAATTPEANRFTMVCLRCERPVLARREWIGQDVKCPHCLSLLRVPPPDPHGRMARAQRPMLGAREYFNFACPGCKSLLEVHDGMCGTPGVCPTCGSRVRVPFVDRRNGLPDPAVLLEKGPAPEADPELADDPSVAAVHAYAAAGDEAPQIVNTDDGERAIQCPRCKELSPIEENACVSCGTPFTMEAAATVGKMRHVRRSNLGIALGVIGIFLFIAVAPSIGAMVLGGLGLMDPEAEGRRGSSWAALVLGLLGFSGGAAYWIWRLI